MFTVTVEELLFFSLIEGRCSVVKDTAMQGNSSLCIESQRTVDLFLQSSPWKCEQTRFRDDKNLLITNKLFVKSL